MSHSHIQDGALWRPLSAADFTGSGAIASDGVAIRPDSLDQTLDYDGSNRLTGITVVYGGNTYVQTYTYTGSNLTGISRWMKQ